MATADQYVAVLESWLAQGIRENPLHSNRTPIGVEFGLNGVAWCAETQSVCQERVGLHCFHTASVAEAKSEAIQGLRGMQWLPRSARIVKADLSVFDFGGRGNPSDFHISCVVDPGTQDKFQTIGGNENDAITKQWRDRTYIQGFIRLPFTGAPPVEEDDEDMPMLINPQGPDSGTTFLLAGDGISGVPSAAVKADLVANSIVKDVVHYCTEETWNFLKTHYNFK